MGNKEAREWLCRYIGDLIEQNGIDYYRQDFNMEPDKYWAAHDEAGRTGMKEFVMSKDFTHFGITCWTGSLAC